jgi:hypothetical protein
MKHFLINLWGELPYLMVLGSGYIIMDRVMFSGRLTGLIIGGWVSMVRRVKRKGILPLKPANPGKILNTVAYDEGLSGHEGELSPESQNGESGNGSFAPASETDSRDGVVPPEDYDTVFADSRLEIVPTANDNEEWIQPVPPGEPDTGSGYNYPDDYDEDYNEFEGVFGVSREAKKLLKKQIRTAMDKTQSDAYKEHPRAEGFMGGYM